MGGMRVECWSRDVGGAVGELRPASRLVAVCLWRSAHGTGMRHDYGGVLCWQYTAEGLWLVVEGPLRSVVLAAVAALSKWCVARVDKNNANHSGKR